MILWLASYPRSGNTFLRTLLFTCFGVETYSIYNDKSDIGKSDTFSETVGHRMFNGSWDAFYDRVTDSDDITAIKTHGAPIDDAKAIYVVRDARAAIVSFHHYLQSYSRYKADVYDVISGAVSYGSWSEHYKSWSPKTRPNTLFLTFEELTGQPDVAIAKIAEFIKLPLKHNTPPTFTELQKNFPEFFRSGSNTKNVSELNEEQLSYLLFIHGETLKQLNYITNYEVCPDTIRKAVGLQSEKLLGFRLSPTAQIQTDMYHVKHIASNIRDMLESDRKVLQRAEYSARKSLEKLKEKDKYTAQLESQLRLQEQEKHQLTTRLEKTAHDLRKAEIEIRDSKAEIQRKKEKLLTMEHVLAPRLSSLFELRALRYVLSERHRIKGQAKQTLNDS